MSLLWFHQINQVFIECSPLQSSTNSIVTVDIVNKSKCQHKQLAKNIYFDVDYKI